MLRVESPRAVSNTHNLNRKADVRMVVTVWFITVQEAPTGAKVEHRRVATDSGHHRSGERRCAAELLHEPMRYVKDAPARRHLVVRVGKEIEGVNLAPHKSHKLDSPAALDTSNRCITIADTRVSSHQEVKTSGTGLPALSNEIQALFFPHQEGHRP